MAIAQVNQQGIFFEDSGGSGPAVVFMHGFLMDQSLFDAQVAELAPRYRCIRWDARGFGQTQWDGKPFSLADSAADCLGLMDHLHIPSAVLVGMSQGGYCALRTALKAPARVQGLVLMSTCSEVDPEPVKAAYRGLRDAWREMGPVDFLTESLATAILGPKEAPGMDAHWNHWLPKWRQLSGENIFHAMNNLLERDEITHRLGEITCPALVTHGAEDTAIPVSAGEGLSRALVGCKEFVVSAGAHAPNLTHPEAINPPLVRFLDGLAKSI